ncbi:MAG: leucine-rich repeat domain-containing protein [Porphyromonas endodontalis]|uniref:leucine-rich repeat domain-containing protein n=1 Tax=Porphyromonas endodontalis TaxID=28124 RepID=UPI00360C9C34
MLRFLIKKGSLIVCSLLLLGSIMGAKAQEEEAITFKRTGNAPKEVVLGIHCRSPFTIDWGDGIREEFPAKNYGVDGIRGEAKGNSIRIYGDPQDFIALYLGNNDKGNSIEELDITRLKRLRFLHCQSNELSQLDLSSGFMLEELHLANNHLKNLDVKHSPRLDMLICYGNEIESLDLSELNRLMALRCENNKISSLQVDHLGELTVLRCGGNPIEQLNVSKNKKLQQLFIENSAIKHIDVSTLDDLRVLNLSGCGMSQLDLSGNPALHVLYANNNELTQLTLTQQPELEKVEVMDNKLQSLSISAPILTDLRCSNNPLQKIDLTKTPLLKYLFCQKTQLQELDLKANKDLCELLASDNQLRQIDLSENKDLYLLWLDGNQLTGLEIAPFAKNLFSLFLANNQFSTSQLQKIVNQLPDISDITVSENKAWWEKWLRLANNPGSNEVDLTLPLRNGWRIDLKENWPGEPSNLASPLYSGINIAQCGANLLITAPNGHAAEYTIYTIEGLPIGGLALSARQTKSITLPSHGCYLVVEKQANGGITRIEKLLVP